MSFCFGGLTQACRVRNGAEQINEYTNTCVHVCLPAWLSVWLSVCLSVGLSVCLSVCLCVCMSVIPQTELASSLKPPPMHGHKDLVIRPTLAFENQAAQVAGPGWRVQGPGASTDSRNEPRTSRSRNWMLAWSRNLAIAKQVAPGLRASHSKIISLGWLP